MGKYDSRGNSGHYSHRSIFSFLVWIPCRSNQLSREAREKIYIQDVVDWIYFSQKQCMENKIKIVAKIQEDERHM